MYGYADYATAIRRMRERLPKEYTVLSFLSSISFLFGSTLAGKPQLPSSSDISSSVIYVPSPLQKSKIFFLQKLRGHFPIKIFSPDTLLI